MMRGKKQISRACWLGVCCLAAWGLPAAGQERVGPSGNVWRWQIDGAVQVEEYEVRRAVMRDLGAQLACHPLAPRGELAAAIAQKLQAALLNAGFAEAHVDARLDEEAQRLCITIHEGPRYVCGQVRIEAAEPAPAEALRERLTQRYPPPEAQRPQTVQRGGRETVVWLNRDGKPVSLKAAIWEAEKPAPLSPQGQASLEQSVREALEDLGYRDARHEVVRQADAQTRTVELVVKIAEWGAPATVQAISVTGHERATEAEVLAFLDVRPGDVLTRRTLAELDQRLWRSGRFVKHQVTAEPTGDESSEKRLKIELRESSYGAPLGHELSREAQALLRWRDWLCDPDRWDGDLVLTQTRSVGVPEIVLSPQQGVMVLHRPNRDVTPPHFALAVTADRFVCRFPWVPQRLETPLGEESFEVRFGIRLNENRSELDKPFQIELGAFQNSDKSELYASGCPVRFSLDVAPSAAMAFTQLRGAQASWQGPVLTVETERERIVIEETTGRLLHFEEKGENRVTMTFVPNAFAQRWDELRPVMESLPNAFDAKRPLSSSLEFVADALAGSPEAWQTDPRMRQVCQVMPMFRTLLQRGVLQDLDVYLVNWSLEPPVRLWIPPESGQPSNWLGAITGNFAFLVADTCFPHGSWMWTVSREVAFALANQSKYLQPTLQQFYRDEEIGPIGSLVVSRLVERLDPRLSRQFALRGLRDTSVDGFRRDFLPLLDDSALAGKLLARLAVVLQELDDATVARWIASLPEEDRVWLAAAVTQLRQLRQLPIDAALALSLEHGWQAGLRARVMAALAARRAADAFPLPPGL